MSRIFDKIRKWWLFTMSNPTVKVGEAGAFKWRFRRFWLEIKTLSDNFRVRFTAAENPYGYLYYGDEEQTQGFAERIYMIGMLLTTDQRFVNDIDKAIEDYQKRMSAENPVVENKDEERIAVEEMRQLQEHIELPKKERKAVVNDIDKRFKKAVKKAQTQK